MHQSVAGITIHSLSRRSVVAAHPGRVAAFDVQPVSSGNLAALERLFGRAGASNGCWCAYWILGPDYHRRDRALNREMLREAASTGPAPGLLAFEAGADPSTAAAVGWARLTLRSELTWLNRTRALAPVDEWPVLALPCFYVARGHRGKGVTAALIAAAASEAVARHAPGLEAYPVDASLPGATRNAFTGYLRDFTAAGFHEVARRSPTRPIVRLLTAPEGT